MRKLRYLKSALVGGASVLTLAQPAIAKIFDIPRSDLAAALGAYMQQSGVQIVYLDDAVRGHKSPGAKGDYTETAALTQILRGTGFTTQTMASNAIGIVPQQQSKPKPVEQLAQATRRAPGAPMPAASASSIETVVVTAQKKKEDIQQVPIAISAFTQKELTERQIAGGPDLVKEVPNLTFSKTNFTGYNLEIRGIGTQAISVTTDPAVAVAFNGIPFIRNHFFEQEFFDLDNVEVLRGPQGTLYGRNATAGVVNVLPARPTDTYEAMMSADLGNYNNRRLEGMLNLPIVGDTLDLRIAGEWTKRDGYSFNTVTDTPIDGRDLWSSRMTIGWKPTSDIQAYFVWEHFSEDDDRMRTAKQLCKTAPVPSEIDGVTVPNDQGNVELGGSPFLSQSCEAVSLYSPQAFEVPNGFTLPYITGPSIQGVITPNFNPYAGTTQSQNLRDIESALNPTYRAKNDTLEFNADWAVTPALTVTSQTGYNHDFLWSTEDYNRFTTAPGIFTYPTFGNITIPDPNGLGQCTNGSVCTQGGPCTPGTFGCSLDGVFCDPQLGCSDRLVAQDLSEEHAWQASQEFRLASNFSGPLNFSFGANFLHYETEENYYVFINTLTALAANPIVDNGQPLPSWVPGVSDNSQCFVGAGAPGYVYSNPAKNSGLLPCGYIDPNPISSLDNEGHNYFLSQNPYVLNSYATFGEVYYDVTSDLKLTEGVRWTDDQKHFIDIPSELLAGGYGYPVLGVVNQQWDQWTGRSVANWTPRLDFTDQTLVYGSYAHGYKAGGANPPGAVLLDNLILGGCGAGCTGNVVDTNPIHPLTFKPEFIDAFEVGSKNTALDGTLTLNGDVFFYDYKNYQISEIVDRTSINNNFNAYVEGSELEAAYEPLPGLKFTFAGGYENGVLNHGDEAIDLMDRTAGNPGWIVVKPSVTQASNCILPTYVIATDIETRSPPVLEDFCSLAYQEHVDPVTGASYVPYPYGTGLGAYPGFNPASPTATNPDPFTGINAGPAPNNGEGFDKQLGGNQLPNAPHFTTSFSAEYTMPVSEDWAATLHGDFYWQSQSWARVFNDNPYDKLRGYSNVNLSLILTSANGWQVMGYVKNVFNITAITGDFLNSDDSGLTTNVFLTDPRLFGIRVTKHLDEDDGFWGKSWNGSDLFTGLFSDMDNGKPSLWIEIGGDFVQLSDGQQPFDPPFVQKIPSYLPSPLAAQEPPATGLDWETKVSFEPDGSDWVFAAAIRYGRSASNRHVHQQTKPVPVPETFEGMKTFNGEPLQNTPATHYVDTQTSSSESHLIADFMAGKDVGLGMFGRTGSSVVSGGVRMASFTSNSSAKFFSDPDAAVVAHPKYIFKHQYSGSSDAKRSFRGIGPAISWNASTPIGGNEQNGEITVDWGSNAAVLFGRQTAGGRHTTGAYYYCIPGIFTPANCHVTKSHYQHTVAVNRSRLVAVPNVGALFGISFKYQNAKVSFGYRADEFFGVMDGGIDAYKAYDRGFFGPFANVSIGIGG
jgi:iron complex outermembrane receptor protein